VVLPTLVGRHFGPYLIEDVLGKGASATVYRGKRSDGETVAVKVLSTFAMGNADFRRAVAREFNALAKIDHPGVIKAEKMSTIADVLFIELEWIDGPTLADTIKVGKPTKPDEAVEIGANIADALGVCHAAGVVHRDVKLSNTLLRPDGSPVLFDFGLAQDDEDPHAEPGRLYATPLGASPEQVLAKGPVDGRADIYALGVALFRMLTGEYPFIGERMDLLRMHVENQAPHPSSINKKLGREIDELLLRSLAKAPDDRYPNAASFAEAIRGLSNEAFKSKGWRSR